MVTGEDVWNSLPEGEQKSDWDETERNFWVNLRSKKDAENKKIEKNFQLSINEVRLKLSDLTGQRSHLKESQSRLARELAKVEAELARTTDECEEKASRLERIEQDYRASRQKRAETLHDIWLKMRRFFRQKRGENPDTPGHLGPESHGIVLPEMLPEIEPWNQWVEGIQEFEIRRPVKIRRGRHFNTTHLAGIYERTEAKGVKWLSCMIQAIGAIQAKRFLSCDKNEGAFDDCIIGYHGSSGDTIDILASRERAQRKEQLEDGAQETSADRSSETVHQTVEVQPRSEQTSQPESQRVDEQISVPYRPPSPKPALQFPELPPERPLDRQIEKQPERKYERQPGKEPERPVEPQPALQTERQAAWSTVPQPERRHEHQLEKVPDRPNERFHDVIAAKAPERTVEVAPIQTAERPREMSHRQAYGPLPDPPSRLTTALSHLNPLLSSHWKKITRENMVLKNDGNVYTYPECVAGVPLVKINEEHPYWEANWPNVKTLIEPQLARWREKHQAAIEAGPKQDKGGSSKYQIGRQVNRGIKILEFHENGPISPYQLLGKRYIQAVKGGITSYDTLFRLSETISELEKFNLDISPVDWMRQRLHELIQTQGHNFDLPRTIHDFYHDSKLNSLRYKYGFKNIGRPSGAMKARLSHCSPSNTPQPLQKQKSMHLVPTTPREDSFISQSPLPSQSAFSTHLNKKPKYMPSTHGSPVHDEFHFEAWSDTDSCSGGNITKYDWRLAVVKTRLYTSHINVTQYWTWAGQIQCFQHQILKDLKPAKWGLFRDEIDFHVNVAEIEEVGWSIESLRVHIIMKKDAGELAADGKPRGDVMASFPRARKMHRFLFFCRESGMKMAKRAPEQLNNMWDSMASQQLPGRGDSYQHLVE
ncbi:hypothetical protein FPRO04_12283 [Fusarium proliferatum]|nr:hypothetical protein FPRO04_12283 [Fusarium proliferatum]